MIGQHKASPLSKYNFFYQTNTNNIYDIFDDMIELSEKDFFLSSMSMLPDISITDDNVMIFKNMVVEKDDEFVFEQKTQISQQEQLRNHFSESQNKLIVLTKSYSNLKMEKMYFERNNVQVLPYNRIFEYFKLNIKKH